MPTATLTTKGQVTIPLEVREGLGLKAGDRIERAVLDASEKLLNAIALYVVTLLSRSSSAL